MAIAVTCPHCAKTMKVKDEFAGKKGKCPGCAQSILIPELAESITPRTTVATKVAAASATPRVQIVAEPLPTSAERQQASQWRSAMLQKIPSRLPPRKKSLGETISQLILAWVVMSLCIGYISLVCALAMGSVALLVWGPTSWQLGAATAYSVSAIGLFVSLLLTKPFAANWFTKQEGYVLQAAKEPEMFAIFEKLAVALGLSKKVSIRIPMQLVARGEVGQGIVRSMFGRKVDLQIGLPLIAGCSFEQVIALIALSLGRQGQGTLTRITVGGHAWLSRLVRGEDAWDAAISTRLSDSTRKFRKLWMPAKVLCFVPRIIGYPFLQVADLLVSSSVEASEEEAVRLQAELVGTEIPAKAAERLGLLEFGWQGVAADVLFQHREKRLVDNLIVQMQKNLAELPEEVQTLVSQPLPDDPQELALRHWSLAQQQEARRSLNSVGQVSSSEPAWMLLRDFVATCREATWEYYLRRLGPRIQQRKDLLPTTS